eukprot:9320685-Lingulodinium_polyedra.AAC.1
MFSRSCRSASVTPRCSPRRAVCCQRVRARVAADCAHVVGDVYVSRQVPQGHAGVQVGVLKA